MQQRHHLLTPRSGRFSHRVARRSPAPTRTSQRTRAVDNAAKNVSGVRRHLVLLPLSGCAAVPAYSSVSTPRRASEHASRGNVLREGASCGCREVERTIGWDGRSGPGLEWDELDPRSHARGLASCALAVAAVLVFGAIGVVISPAKPAGRHRVPVRPGLRLGRELDGERLRPFLGRSRRLAHGRHVPGLHRRQRLRLQRELLRRRRPQRRSQRVFPQRHLHRRLRRRGWRTRSRSSSTTRGTSTSASSRPPTSPSSTRRARTSPTSGR